MAKRAYKGRVTRPCEGCGLDVSRKHSELRAHTFCSNACYLASDYFISRRNASNARRFEGMRETRPCRQCGKNVERPRSQFKARTYCSISCRRAESLALSTRQLNSSGYVIVFVGRDYPGAGKQGHILEHRKVMQDHLGRPLTKDENVHHKNGVKTDNRLENLELWTRSQPYGQRVEDKIAWAREFLAFYNAN